MDVTYALKIDVLFISFLERSVQKFSMQKFKILPQWQSSWKHSDTERHMQV